MTADWRALAFCKCGQEWHHPLHMQVQRMEYNNEWRGPTVLLTPFRQWMRENLPRGPEGFTCAGDDGFVRWFTKADPMGHVALLEVKTRGAPLDIPTRNTIRALDAGRYVGALVVSLDGNVPSPLRHWPSATYGYPEAEVVSDVVRLNGERVTPSELRARILRTVQL